MILTVIGIGLGAAGVGGPALLGVIGSTALLRTVVDSAVTAAAGGTVTDIGKTAAAGAAKGALAGLAGDILGDIFDGIEISGDEDLSVGQVQQDIPLADTGMSQEEIDDFMAREMRKNRQKGVFS